MLKHATYDQGDVVISIGSKHYGVNLFGINIKHEINGIVIFRNGDTIIHQSNLLTSAEGNPFVPIPKVEVYNDMLYDMLVSGV